MSIKAIRSAVNRQLPIVMAAQKDPAVESPNDTDIYRIGVVGNLLKVADLPENTVKALIECGRRVRACFRKLAPRSWSVRTGKRKFVRKMTSCGCLRRRSPASCRECGLLGICRAIAPSHFC